jgi:hypothetical protein
MTTAKSKLSKEDFDRIVGLDKKIFGDLKIQLDDYVVTYSLEHSSATKAHVMTYVNNHFSGSWCRAKENCPEQQFLKKKEVSLYSPKEKKQLIKDFGKRKAAQFFEIDKKSHFYSPYWPSWKAVANHLKKIAVNFDKVELIKESSV